MRSIAPSRSKSDAPLAWLVLSGAVLLGCGSGSATNDGAGAEPDADDIVSCAGDPRLDPLVDGGYTKTGEGGALAFDVIRTDPALPVRGINTWTLRLRDAAGLPLSGAAIAASATMPDHGHESPTTPLVTETSGGAGDGVYTVAPLDFFMPGVWRVELDVGGAEGGAPRDTVAFVLCVE